MTGRATDLRGLPRTLRILLHCDGARQLHPAGSSSSRTQLLPWKTYPQRASCHERARRANELMYFPRVEARFDTCGLACVSRSPSACNFASSSPAKQILEVLERGEGSDGDASGAGSSPPDGTSSIDDPLPDSGQANVSRWLMRSLLVVGSAKLKSPAGSRCWPGHQLLRP